MKKIQVLLSFDLVTPAKVKVTGKQYELVELEVSGTFIISTTDTKKMYQQMCTYCPVLSLCQANWLAGQLHG